MTTKELKGRALVFLEDALYDEEKYFKEGRSNRETLEAIKWLIKKAKGGTHVKRGRG
jgi:hypothetical protein